MIDESGSTMIGTIGLLTIAIIITGSVFELNARLIEQRCMREWVAAQTSQAQMFANAARRYAQEKRPDWETTATKTIYSAELKNNGLLPGSFQQGSGTRFFSFVARARFSHDGELQLAVLTRGQAGETDEKLCGRYRQTPELLRKLQQRMASYFGRNLKRSIFTPAVINPSTMEAQGLHGKSKTNNPVMRELIRGDDQERCQPQEDFTQWKRQNAPEDLQQCN